jgi:hypothetical protein
MAVVGLVTHVSPPTIIRNEIDLLSNNQSLYRLVLRTFSIQVFGTMSTLPETVKLNSSKLHQVTWLGPDRQPYFPDMALIRAGSQPEQSKS